MIKRTIEISGQGNHLYVSEGSLCIRRGRQVVGRVPLEDLGVLILDTPTVTYTHSVLTAALEAGAVIVPCGSDHHPRGLFLPQGNTLQTQRLRAQVAASLPLRKRLWRQVVRAKIRNQADILTKGCTARKALVAMIPCVRSGDPTNVEARAARRYWPALLGEQFRRARDGAAPNNLLNYGYMVVRAAVARAICGAGLHPSLGLQHHNRGNRFCLADDLLEPLRPMVDERVRALWTRGCPEVDRETKTELLSILTRRVETAGSTGPLLVGLERTMASLVRCYAGQDKLLELPTPCN